MLALENVFDTGLATVLDAFQTANEVSEMCELAIPRFQVNVVGVRKRVRTAQGLNVPVRAADAPPADCVVVPAIGFKMPERLLVRSVSPQLASLTAKYLIVDSRPSQSAYALTDHLQVTALYRGFQLHWRDEFVPLVRPARQPAQHILSADYGKCETLQSTIERGCDHQAGGFYHG